MKMQVSNFTGDARVQKLTAKLKECCKGKKFSDIIDDDGNQYVDLVMEGGGVLGIALVGYTYVLEEAGIRFLGVGGTSAGAINALLLAGLNPPAKRKSLKMVDLLANLDLNSFVDGNRDAKNLIEAALEGAGPVRLGLSALRVIDELWRDLGLNPGKAFHEWLKESLAKEGIHTTKQLRQRQETLPKGLRVRKGDVLSLKDAAPVLSLVAADITTETKVEFPKMAAMYWNNPDDVNPADYVRASMSIPFFFHPFRIENVPQGKKATDTWQKLASYDGSIPKACTLVDGGIMSNFPIDLFHNASSVPTAPTFGAKLGTNERQTRGVTNPFNLATATFSAASHTLDYDFIARNPDYRKLVTWIDTGDHSWLNFGMTAEEKLDLFCRGAEAAVAFLDKFSWSNYKSIRRQLAKAHIKSKSA